MQKPSKSLSPSQSQPSYHQSAFQTWHSYISFFFLSLSQTQLSLSESSRSHLQYPPLYQQPRSKYINAKKENEFGRKYIEKTDEKEKRKGYFILMMNSQLTTS